MTERLIEIFSHESSSIPPADTEAPFIELLSPADATTGNARDTTISLRITDTAYDVNSGVDMTKTRIKLRVGFGSYETVYDGSAGGFQSGFSGSVTDVFADGLSYDIEFTRDSYFTGSATVQMQVHVQDLQTVTINTADYGYSFGIAPQESAAPYLLNQEPAPGSVGSNPASPITFSIIDDLLDPDSGVDIDTLQVSIQQGPGADIQAIIVDGVVQAGFSAAFTPVGVNYDVIISATDGFSQAENITLFVSVADTTPNANTLNTSYGYLTGVAVTELEPEDPGHMGPLEALTAAIGDELNELAGGLDTRLTQAWGPAEIVQSGAGLLNASSVDGGITVTFPSGTLSDEVLAGQTFKLLTNLAGLETRSCEILGVASPEQIVLTSPGLGDNFSAESWEIRDVADDSVAVESTIGFQSSGQLIIDGTIYSYTGKTSTTFERLTYVEDGEVISGARVLYQAETLVTDYSLTYSALDLWRNSFFPRTAEGEDLSIIGDMLGVPRDSAWSDEVFRAILMATSYITAGVKPAIDQILQVLFGVGNYDMLTQHTGYSPARPAEVFFRAARDIEDQFIGKTFLEDGEYAALNADLTTIDVSADLVHSEFNPITHVTLASDPFPQGRVVAGGDAVDLTVDLDNILWGDSLIASAPSSFSAVLIGDKFRITDGARAGEEFCVRWKSSSSSIVLAPIAGQAHDFGYLSEPDGSIYALGASWLITRPASICAVHLPSAETELSDPNDFTSAVRPAWIFNGTATEGVVAASNLTAMSFDLTSTSTAYYTHPARLQAGSDFEFHVRLRIRDTADLDSLVGDRFQLGVWDGTKKYTFGFKDTGSGTYSINLYTAGGAAASGTGYISHPGIENQFQLITIRRRVEQSLDSYTQQTIEILVDGVLTIRTEAYTSLASHDGLTDMPSIWFGKRSAVAGPIVDVSSIGWHITTPTDFYSAALAVTLGSGGAPQEVLDPASSGILSSATGVRLLGYSAAAPTYGYGEGNFELESSYSDDRIKVMGTLHSGAETYRLVPDVIVFTEENLPLRYPRDRGASIRIESGPNIGTYPIVEFLDAALTAIEEDPAQAVKTTGLTQNMDIGVSAVRVDLGSLPYFTSDQAVQWRLIPGFAIGTNQLCRIPRTGSYASGTVTLSTAPKFVYSAGVFEPTFRVGYNTVASAILLQNASRVRQTGVGPITYDNYPFYLYDSFGPAGRTLVQRLLPAGVRADFDRLVRDDTGLHIAE